MTHHAHHRVVCLRARRIEEYVLQIAAKQLRQLRRELHSRRRRRLEERVIERQLLHLLGRGAHQFLTAIAHIHAPKAGHAVQYGVAFAIIDR